MGIRDSRKVFAMKLYIVYTLDFAKVGRHIRDDFHEHIIKISSGKEDDDSE